MQLYTHIYMCIQPLQLYYYSYTMAFSFASQLYRNNSKPGYSSQLYSYTYSIAIATKVKFKTFNVCIANYIACSVFQLLHQLHSQLGHPMGQLYYIIFIKPNPQKKLASIATQLQLHTDAHKISLICMVEILILR